MSWRETFRCAQQKLGPSLLLPLLLWVLPCQVWRIELPASECCPGRA